MSLDGAGSFQGVREQEVYLQEYRLRNSPREDSLTKEAAESVQNELEGTTKWALPYPLVRALHWRLWSCKAIIVAKIPLFIVLRNFVGLMLCGIISSELTTSCGRLIVPAVEEITVFGNVFDGPMPIMTSMVSRSTNARILERLSPIITRENFLLFFD